MSHVMLSLTVSHRCVRANREWQHGVARKVALLHLALLPVCSKTSILTVMVGLVIKPHPLPCWHAETLLYLTITTHSFKHV